MAELTDDTRLTLAEREHLYLPLLARTAYVYSLPPHWLVGIARVESGFHTRAAGTSAGDMARGGSTGLTQMSLQTARALGFTGSTEDLYAPATNARLAAMLIVHNMRSFRVDSIEDVAALYNSGKRFAQAPASTRLLYVPAVRRFAAMYKARAEAAAAP